MEIQSFFQSEIFRHVIATSSFIVTLLLLFFIDKKIFQILKKRAAQSPGILDDFVVNLFKIPALVFGYWITSKLFTHFFFNDLTITSYLNHLNALILVFVIAWLAMQVVKAITYYMQSKLDIKVTNNLNARKSLTQINVFKAIANAIIITIAIASALMTFEQARSIGLSLLTSAGIAGIIVGLAAQKSIGMILAGIQLAITQPIRLDDVVIVEGEWGRIEEITLTYVVVKIWDERRLVLPVTWFLEKPFQNWTRTSADILGTIFMYVDYAFPVDKLREKLAALVKDNPNWDKRVANIQVTDQTNRHKELRILVSSADSSKNWDLRVDLREKLTDYIQQEFPESFAKIRISENKK
ncbi:MAG: mechanosensitive ion channel [Paludibacter sp.]|nr:mechanosensitive ion channel [Paludibacter sp.]